MKFAAVFPGQGSQTIGMGKFLFENFDIARHLFEEASDTIKINMKSLLFEGPEDKLQLTQNTQPAIVLVSTCAFRILEDHTPLTDKISYLAGHSIGEYSAAVAGGVLKFQDAIFAVYERGKAMQEAVPLGKGAMTAVLGLTRPQVQHICEWATKTCNGKIVEPANYNSPDQVVISGYRESVDWLAKNYSSEQLSGFENIPKKVRFIPLNVSAPFHCRLMQPAQDKMKVVLEGLDFKNSKWPIIQNVDAQPQADRKQIRQNLIRQISASVLWSDSMLFLHQKACVHHLELGQSKVLAGLGKKISSDINVHCMTTLDEFRNLEKILKS